MLSPTAPALLAVSTRLDSPRRARSHAHGPLDTLGASIDTFWTCHRVLEQRCMASYASSRMALALWPTLSNLLHRAQQYRILNKMSLRPSPALGHCLSVMAKLGSMCTRTRPSRLFAGNDCSLNMASCDRAQMRDRTVLKNANHISRLSSATPVSLQHSVPSARE